MAHMHRQLVSGVRTNLSLIILSVYQMSCTNSFTLFLIFQWLQWKRLVAINFYILKQTESFCVVCKWYHYTHILFGAIVLQMFTSSNFQFKKDKKSHRALKVWYKWYHYTHILFGAIVLQMFTSSNFSLKINFQFKKDKKSHIELWKSGMNGVALAQSCVSPQKSLIKKSGWLVLTHVNIITFISC